MIDYLVNTWIHEQQQLAQSPDCAPKKHNSHSLLHLQAGKRSPGPAFWARKKHQFLKILTKFRTVQKEELPISTATFWDPT